MLTDVAISILFIGLGLYGTLNNKKASKEAIEARTNNYKNLFGKKLKVGKTTEVFHEKFLFIMSFIFLVIGIITLFNQIAPLFS